VVTGNGQSEGPDQSRRTASAAGPARVQKRPTSRTSRAGAIRSSACALRPATVQISRATVPAAGRQQLDRVPEPDQAQLDQAQPDQAQADQAQAGQAQRPDRLCSRLTTTGNGAPRSAGPVPAPAARTPRPGTDRPPAAQSARGRSAGIHQCLASHRRCTRQGSSQHGTAVVMARAGQRRPQDGLTAPCRAAAAPTACHAQASASPAVTPGSRGPGRRPQRGEQGQKPTARLAITSARTAPKASQAIQCWPSATRPPM
jgi:hypothetical protein